MFGFGKALDVLRAGDAVRREEWVDVALMLAPRQASALPPGTKGTVAEFVGPEAIIYIPDQLMLVTRDGHLSLWTPVTADLLAEDWDYVPEPDDHEPHGAQQAEHWPQAVPASMWCTVDAKRAKVNSIIWSPEATPRELGLNCGHWVAMPADWQAPA